MLRLGALALLLGLCAGNASASGYESFYASAEKHRQNGNLEAAATDYAKAAVTTNDPFVAAPALTMQCIMLGDMRAWARAAEACGAAAGKIPVTDGRTVGMSAIAMYNELWALYAQQKFDDAIQASERFYSAHAKSTHPRAYDLLNVGLLVRAWSFTRLRQFEHALAALSEPERRQWPVLQDDWVRGQRGSAYASEHAYLRIALLGDMKRMSEIAEASAQLRDRLHSTGDPEHREIGTMLRLCEAAGQHNVRSYLEAQNSINAFHAELEKNRQVNGRCHPVPVSAAQIGQFCGVPLFTATYPQEWLQHMQKNGTGPADLTGAISDYAAGRHTESLEKMDRLIGALRKLPEQAPLEIGIKRLEHIRRVVLEQRCP